MNITTKSIKAAFSLAMGAICWHSAQAQSVIDLSKPVSDSIGTITGVYYKFNSTNTTIYGPATPDLSGNSYTGYLDAGTNVPVPSLTGGVNLSGTSGYSNGLVLYSPSTASADMNRVYATLPISNNLAMVATDFTAGMWLRFDSVSTNTQKIILMDRGGMNTMYGTNTGHWTLFLDKDASDNWLLGFQVGNGMTNQNGYNNSTYQNLNLQDGAWHHLGFTYNYDATNDNVVTFWQDGASIGSASFDIDITSGDPSYDTRRFAVGNGAVSQYTTYLDGDIDDLFVTTGLYTFQPVPEPGSVALILFAAGLFASFCRRKSTSC